MKSLIGDYDSFVANINSRFLEIGIYAKSEFTICDHLCYRVETDERYQEMKTLLGSMATSIGEVPVSGRLISTFELQEPIETGGWVIPWIELPAPKEGSEYKEGLEHAEFVVVKSLDDFRDRHSDLPFNDEGISKIINPELGLKIPGLSVKFHEISLGAVVRLERRLEKN